jgi:hypothetical protein
VGDRTPHSLDKLDRRLTQLAEFVETHPGLLPANVDSPEFLSRLREDAPRLARHEHFVTRQLAADTDYVALCHWNANVDNAWFWRDTGGLHCGLMDWGCVSQMNMGMAIWGVCLPRPGSPVAAQPVAVGHIALVDVSSTGGAQHTGPAYRHVRGVRD